MPVGPMLFYRVLAYRKIGMQVLASSFALEILFSTCLRERIDADLQLLDLLQKVFPGIIRL